MANENLRPMAKEVIGNIRAMYGKSVRVFTSFVDQGKRVRVVVQNGKSRGDTTILNK